MRTARTPSYFTSLAFAVREQPLVDSLLVVLVLQFWRLLDIEFISQNLPHFRDYHHFSLTCRQHLPCSSVQLRIRLLQLGVFGFKFDLLGHQGRNQLIELGKFRLNFAFLQPASRQLFEQLSVVPLQKLPLFDAICMFFRDLIACLDLCLKTHPLKFLSQLLDNPILLFDDTSVTRGRVLRLTRYRFACVSSGMARSDISLLLRLLPHRRVLCRDQQLFIFLLSPLSGPIHPLMLLTFHLLGKQMVGVEKFNGAGRGRLGCCEVVAETIHRELIIRIIPSIVQMSEEMRRLVPQRFYTHHYQEVSFKTSFQNCVLKALQARRWRQVEGGPWLLQWTEKERTNDVFEEKLTPAQRVNHFRLWGQLCRKDMMIKNIRKHKRQLQKDKMFVEEDWDFLPLTFFLPSEYIMFAEEFRKKGGLWIMKPTSRCQGQGIFIVDKLAQVAPYRHKIAPVAPPQPQLVPKPALPNFKAKAQDDKRDDSNDEEDNQEGEERNEEAPAQSYLIQQYISRPLLLGFKKFDLRIYCLCTNYSQLTAWLYRSGFARFTHQPYNTEDIGHLEGHLTNVEIQKHSENYDQIRGGKWLVDRLKVFLLSRYAPSRVEWSFAEIRDIIIRSLQSVQRSILPSRNSFELYGYDFMLDADLKPWLIEINGGPSMTANTDFDCRLKCGLIDDVLSIVDVEGLLTGNEMNVGGFDLIVQKGQRVRQPTQSSTTCLLGARNQRIKVMRHLARSFLLRKTREEQTDETPDEEPKVKQKEKAKDKLLPNFYYNMRRQEDIDQESGQRLKDELQFLEEVGDKDEDFSSLRKYLQSDA